MNNVKKFSLKVFPVLLPSLVLLFSFLFFWGSISVSHGVSPEATQTPAYDTKMLRREFIRAQETEMKNFEIREKNAAQKFKQRLISMSAINAANFLPNLIPASRSALT
jgi:hypothetical protein